MKLLFLCDVFFPDTIGGAGRVACHLSFELSRKGHEVYIITRNPDARLPGREKLADHLFVHRFDISSVIAPGMLVSELHGSGRLAKRLSLSVSFDLVCAHQSLVAFGPLLSGRLRSVPFVYYFHSPWHEEYLIKHTPAGGRPRFKTRLVARVMRSIEGHITRRADICVVLSDYMGRALRSAHRIPGNKIVKIPGGVDLQRFTPAPRDAVSDDRSQDRFDDRVQFLTVRNLVPRMGLERLIVAFGESELLRRNAWLLVAGKGPMEDQLKSLARAYGMDDVVRFIGYVPDRDLPSLYRTADFFVLPTRELEGFGLVNLEALACGTPVLGTPVGAIPQILGAFEKKFLFRGSDWQDIRLKLEEVIEKPDKYKIDPSACRQFVKDTYSWEKMASAFEKVVALLPG